MKTLGEINAEIRDAMELLSSVVLLDCQTTNELIARVTNRLADCMAAGLAASTQMILNNQLPETRRKEWSAVQWERGDDIIYVAADCFYAVTRHSRNPLGPYRTFDEAADALPAWKSST